MSRFWKEKSTFDPRRFYYYIEIRGIKYGFHELENISGFKKELAETPSKVFRRHVGDFMWALVSGRRIENRFLRLRFAARQTYVYLRRRGELLRLLDRACEHFRLERSENAIQDASFRNS